MSYTVYVPQHRSARLAAEHADYHQITGLFTSQFSSCNLLVFINEKAQRIALFHADVFSQVNLNNLIKNEIEWTGLDTQVIVIYRDAGIDLKEEIAKTFQNDFSAITIRFEKAQSDVDGLQVSFQNKMPYSFHPFIKTYKVYETPEKLLRHPQERKFLNVTKIEQVIGLRARSRTGFLLKNSCIFDQFGWVRLDEKELALDITDDEEKGELLFFLPYMSNIVLTAKLIMLIEEIKKSILFAASFEVERTAESIAEYLEDYLNPKATPEKLLRQNLLTYIQDLSQPQFADEIKGGERFLEKLQAISDKDNLAKNIENAINSMDEKSDLNVVEKIAEQIKAYLRHYYRRVNYINSNNERASQQENAAKLSLKAAQHVVKKEFQQAINLAKEAIQFFVHSSFVNVNLATVYYTLGIALLQSENVDEAHRVLKLCRDIQYACNVPEQYRKKTEHALSECENKIRDQSNQQEESNELTPYSISK